ncbi:MAG: SpoIID/LytB domain-containing protein [Thermoleophilia bacterium]|nr:SpoIID/LytB domain-containing protein [Thermoleophilia bacterium]
MGGVVLAGPLAATAGAQEVTFTFEGRGFGHGVGMSQYGARGMALRGWDAARILTWYYRGTRIADGPAKRVRVLVANNQVTQAVAVEGGGTLIDPHDAERIPLAPGVRYVARVSAKGLEVVQPENTSVDVSVGNLRIAPAAGGFVRVGSARYRGVVDLVADGGYVDVVNTVDMEDYLRGVLPREVPASWGDRTPAALQAQAVAARSYAIAQLRPSQPFDLYADVRSQVYGGVNGEDPRTDAAVAATRRRVLMYGEVIIPAYFSSTSGGHTENVENSLGGGPKPYLVGVPDPYDDVSPLHRWPDPPSWTATQLGQRLRLPAAVTEVEVLRRGVSPRVITVRFRTKDGGATDLSGASVKARLGLHDTWFWVRRSDRPAPQEPAYDGGAKTPPPTTPAPTTPVSQPGAKVGDFLVVASRQPSMNDAKTVLRLVRRARPSARVLTRRRGATKAFLVVTQRTASRAAALMERDRLVALGYAATLARAVAGDPAVVLKTAAVAAVTYRVIAADLRLAGRARSVAVRLRGTGRRADVVRRATPRGTRYVVVTLRGVTRTRARAERVALRRLGLSPRLELVRPS